MNMKKNQQGFALGVIIGIVGLLAVLGAVVVNSLGGGSNNTATEQDKLNASAIMMQSGSIKDAMDLLVAQQRADYEDIQLNSTWNPGTDAYGLYNAPNGTLEYVVPPKAAFTAASTAEWTLTDHNAVGAVDFDGNGTNDGFISVQTLNTPVCEAINDALGLGATATPTTTGRTGYCTSGVYYKAVEIR